MASGLIMVDWEGDSELRVGMAAFKTRGGGVGRIGGGAGGPWCSDALGNLRVRTRMGEDRRAT